jgi:hypothetical protein
MGDDDYRQPGASQPVQHLHQRALAGGVESGEGFVEY